MSNCRKCRAEILWLKCQNKDGEISEKANPIDAVGTPDGNLVINREKGIYRFATGNEKEVAKNDGKNLYTSHFATCKFAEEFRNKD